MPRSILQRSGDTLHYDDRDYVVLVWDHGDCGTGRIIGSAAKKMRPVIRFLFLICRKNIKRRSILQQILLRISSGLGWAATPAGLKAMKELETLEEERRAGKAPGPVRRKGVASNEMCTF